MKVLVINRDPEAAISGGFHRHQLDTYDVVVIARPGNRAHLETVSDESALLVLMQEEEVTDA